MRDDGEGIADRHAVIDGHRTGLVDPIERPLGEGEAALRLAQHADVHRHAISKAPRGADQLRRLAVQQLQLELA